MTAHSHTDGEACIPYGRGGAGNMYRPSTIRTAWLKLSSSPTSSPLTLTSSPEDHYGASKTTPRRRSTNSGSSMWSSSTIGGEERRGWKKWLGLGRRGSVHMEEDVKEELKEE